MSRLYEAVRQMGKEHGQAGTSPFTRSIRVLDSPSVFSAEVDNVSSVRVHPTPAARLVALSEVKSLGAEKFRALATRLENVRRQKGLKSVQVTSALVNEGKTLVAANLAFTIAKAGSTVLLVEGDLHRPSIQALLGLRNLRGLGDWWSDQARDISHSLHKLNDMPLWLLSAGAIHEEPSTLLQSNQFGEVVGRLADSFDWIVVDSTPMLPVVDANLWSRLVDGTILVVRRGVASAKALKRGLKSIDDLKLVGIVLNDAAESDPPGYIRYCGTTNRDTSVMFT
jgi:capsular exopolysaccharide synthesis family protein